MSIDIGKYFYRFSLAGVLSLCLTGLTSSAYAMTYLEKDDKDITHRELSNFDGFLDKHPAVAKDLRQNPSLINDQVYLQNHTELREFLNNHPGVREELKEDPALFMKREHRFDQSGEDIKRHELSAFDEFLDKHPAIAKDLRQNPSLVKDQNYLNSHAELREFLNGHPGVRQELREDPAVFMKREHRFDQSGQDITRSELDKFDDFLDKHPAIAKDLRQNPSLVKDQNYLNSHAELREFLNGHPGVRQELREDPAIFMKREHRFDQSGQDITRSELDKFDDFLDAHPATAKDLRQNPSLVKDQNYLNSHAELRDFLNSHHRVRQELREDPAVFMKHERHFERHEEHGKN